MFNVISSYFDWNTSSNVSLSNSQKDNSLDGVAMEAFENIKDEWVAVNSTGGKDTAFSVGDESTYSNIELLQTVYEKEMSEELKSEIQNYVSNFLKDYIMGTITPETDDKNRPPIVEKLLDEFDELLLYDREDVEQIAYEAYLDSAVRGLYSILKRRTNRGYRPNFSTRVLDIRHPALRRIFLPELIKALKIDFPSKMEIVINYDNEAKQFELEVMEAFERIKCERMEHLEG